MRYRSDWPRPHRADTRAVALGVLAAAIVFGAAGCSGPTDLPSTAASVVSPIPGQGPGTVATSDPASTPVSAAHLGRSTPVRLQIPAIGVDSPLIALGLKPDGAMEVPPQGFPAGWYTGAPTPGELGPAIIAGHVDWNGPGVFYDLHKLKPDDLISVTREDGSVAAFRVTRVEQFAKDAFPTDLVYGNIDHAGLRLITCGGSWNTQTHHYEDNIVTFASYVPPGS